MFPQKCTNYLELARSYFMTNYFLEIMKCKTKYGQFAKQIIFNQGSPSTNLFQPGLQQTQDLSVMLGLAGLAWVHAGKTAQSGSCVSNLPDILMAVNTGQEKEKEKKQKKEKEKEKDSQSPAVRSTCRPSHVCHVCFPQRALTRPLGFLQLQSSDCPPSQYQQQSHPPRYHRGVNTS